MAAVDYVRALMAGPEHAGNYAFRIAEMQAMLINSAANFYNARLNRDELVINSATAQKHIEVSQASLAVEQFRWEIGGRVQAAVGAAEAAAKTAQAALSALNSIASVSQQL